MRHALLCSAVLLSACSSAPDAPTRQEAESALADAMHLAWVATAAPERSPVRVAPDGQLIALVATGTPATPLRAPSPPIVSVSAVDDCVANGDAVACETSYVVDGTSRSPVLVRYWRHGSDWRARFVETR